MAYQRMVSTKATKRNLKIMIYGKTNTRKTEFVLRYFPNVVVIDAEGNVEQCLDVPEIAPFEYVKTKDARVVNEVIDDISTGKFKMTNGATPETFAIDSVSVIWSVQQEAAYAMAEKRAAKYGRGDVTNATQLDWAVSKRPMKIMSNRVNGSPIRYLFYIAREKELSKDNPDGSRTILGYVPNIVKDQDFDMNLILRFGYDDNKKWFYEVIKTQGGLSKILPPGSRGYEFPIDKLLEYANHFTPTSMKEMSEVEVGNSIADDELLSGERSLNALKIMAAKVGLEGEAFGEYLKQCGFQGFNINNWEKMVEAINQYQK